jgi:hypothetical protein
LLIQEMVHNYGLPVTIIEVRGPLFALVFWQQCCHCLGIEQTMSTSLYFQINRYIEGMNHNIQ